MFNPLDDVAHVIQTALTPAFMLAGLAAFLGVFSGRLDRVGDQIAELTLRLDGAERAEAMICARHLGRLRRRIKLLDAAVVLGALGGGLICLAALLLFIGGFHNVTMTADVLLGAFGLALALTIGAIGAFLAEMLLSSRSLREDACVRQIEAENGTFDPALAPLRPA